MTSFDTLTAIPCRFTAGEVVTWTETLTGYDVSAFSVAYLFAGQTPIDGFQQFTINGSGAGTVWTFATPADPKPGNYKWEKQITKTAGSVMRVFSCGHITVLPNTGASATVTNAQSMVAALESALQTFATTTETSVSTNGHSFTRANIDSYRDELTYWQSRVIAEQRALGALSGCGHGGLIVPQFLPPVGGPRFSGFGPYVP